MAGWVAGAVVGSALIGAAASSSAANKQAGAAEAATAAQREALARQTELNQPFYDVGVNATNRLANQQQYTPAAFNYEADPGYAFRFNEGMKGLNATAAARGGLISGNALRAASDYGQASGSQEYQNAYNRYLANNAQNLQAYNTNTANQQYLANLGQSSANNQANQIGNFGNAAAGNMIGAANAGAAGTVGTANALTSGVGTYLNYNQNQNMLNAFNNRSAYTNLSNQYGANNVYGGGNMNPVYTPPSVAEYALNNPNY
jgi:hypothetical protein